jgi:DNA-nicking Smr family endonuclease
VSLRVQPWLNFGVDDEPIQLPIDGVLDLHTFRPRDVKPLVLEYLTECRTRGILRVRIIHGKGIGQLRETVHQLLAKHPDVVEFHLASEHFGGWGATIVHLKPSSSQ